MFKTETHLHTAEVSPCSKIRARQMVRKYKDAGYHTIFVTDHFQSANLDLYGDIKWEDKMTIFLSGYYIAKCEGEKIGLNVLLGAEIRFTEAANHYLVYGISKEFLDSYPDLHTYGIEKFSKIACEHNLFVVQAHPYRDGNCFPTPDYIDGVEVYNSNPRHNDYSEKSFALAQERNLPVIGGSDAHRDEDVGLSGIETSVEIKSVEKFVEAVKCRQMSIIGGNQ